MLVILSNVLELFFAYCAIERPKGLCDLGLDIRSASDGVLLCRESLRAAQSTTTTTYFSFRALVVTLLEITFRSQFTTL